LTLDLELLTVVTPHTPSHAVSQHFNQRLIGVFSSIMPEHVEEFLKALTANRVGDVSYFAYQNEQNLLFEKGLTTSQLSLPTSISAAKPNTAATYFANQDEKRYIYFLGAGDVIQEAWYDADKGEWTATNLGDSGIITHGHSKLATSKAFGPDDNLVLFFQDSSGSLKETAFDKLGRPGQPRDITTASPAIGTNLWALKTMEGSVRLFYVGKDSAIHQSVYQNEEWADSRIENTEDISPTSRIVADIWQQSFVLYFQTTVGGVVSVTEGERTNVVTHDPQCSQCCIIQ